jgi:hypothetical protein
LTSDDDPNGHGLDGGEADKTQFRLTVDVPDNGLLFRWIDWAAEHATPDTVRRLHLTASGFDSWYVYFGVIDRSAIVNCVDTRTGREVEDWANRPQSPSDVKPVPSWRRAAWHKKLLRDVAKAVMSRH